MDDFTLPELKEPGEIPKLNCGVMAHCKPYVAAPEHQKALGFPGELVEGWHDKAIAKFGELLNGQRVICTAGNAEVGFAIFGVKQTGLSLFDRFQYRRVATVILVDAYAKIDLVAARIAQKFFVEAQNRIGRSRCNIF